MYPKMPRRYLFGQLTTSSNAVIEPFCARILADVQDVTNHFSRLVVRQISPSDQALAQFEREPIVAAAKRWPTPRCR